MKNLFFILAISLLFGNGFGATEMTTDTQINVIHQIFVWPSALIMIIPGLIGSFIPYGLAWALGYAACFSPLAILFFRGTDHKFHALLRYSLSLLFLKIATDVFSMDVEGSSKKLTVLEAGGGLFQSNEKRSVTSVLARAQKFLWGICLTFIVIKAIKYSGSLLRKHKQGIHDKIVQLITQKKSIILSVMVVVVAILISAFYMYAEHHLIYLLSLHPGFLYSTASSVLPSDSIKATASIEPSLIIRVLINGLFIVALNIVSIKECCLGFFDIFSFVAYQSALAIIASRIMYRVVYITQNVGESGEKSRIGLDTVIWTSSSMLALQAVVYGVAFYFRSMMKLQALYTCSQAIVFAIMIAVDRFLA